MPHRPPLGLFDNEVRLYSLDELTETVRLLERSLPGRAVAELSDAVFAELAMKRSRRAVWTEAGVGAFKREVGSCRAFLDEGRPAARYAHEVSDGDGVVYLALRSERSAARLSSSAAS